MFISYGSWFESGRNIDPTKQYLVTGIIILTFFVFYAIPFAVFQTSKMHTALTEGDKSIVVRKQTISSLLMVLGLSRGETLIQQNNI